jgi:4-amino-4-deoxy-L-arabinose transferase-like glycosyltransferase
VNAEAVYNLLMSMLMIFSAVMSATFLLRSEYEDRGSPWVWAAAFALTSLAANVLFVVAL